MGINSKERIIEEKRLSKTIDQIKKYLEEEKKFSENYQDELLSIQREMWQGVMTKPEEDWSYENALEAWYFQNDVAREGRKFKSSKKKIDKLEKMKSSPYFGRIDFRENYEDNHEELYIGISNIADEETLDFLTIDWRAPIASIFYDYEIGNAKYNSPTSTIEGELLLKRQYKISNGSLKYMLDSSLKINDDILQEILSRSIDNKMKSIVTSIQREQNTIIRDDYHKLMIVQGPAGSGKTSIALHRIAYLLYRHQNSMNSKNVVIFSPNSVFNDYISDVLPELGEENMHQTTFIDFAEKLLGSYLDIEDMNGQMERLLLNENNEYDIISENIIFKSSDNFINILNNYIKYIENESITFDDLYYNEILIISSKELHDLLNNEYIYLPFFKRLTKIRNRVMYLLKPYEDTRREEIYEEIKKLDNLSDDERIRSKSESLLREEFMPIKDNIVNKTSFDIIKIYKTLFEDEELFKKLNDNKLPKYFNEISSTTIENVNIKNIKYEDVAPLLYLKTVLSNLSTNIDIRHIVIDEAQDYTKLHYMIFSLLFPYCGFTLLGDLSQSINPYINIGNYENVLKAFNWDKSMLLSLSKSYRSTNEITSFTKSMLNENIKFEHVERNGVKPKVIKVNKKNILHNILLDIKSFINDNLNSIAIICKTNKECMEVYNNLKDKIDISIICSDDINYPDGVVVIPSYLAKGLEFDAVIAYDCSENNYKMSKDYNLLYTVCTRALHRLNIYYTDNLSSILQKIDSNLYQSINL